MMARGRPSSKNRETAEDIALRYCYEEGFKVGYLIGKYGEDYLHIIEMKQDVQEIRNLNEESRQALNEHWRK